MVQPLAPQLLTKLGFSLDSLHLGRIFPVISILPGMDGDLIQLVNKLQDTFANLGERAHWPLRLRQRGKKLTKRVGGELDMPQLAVVSGTIVVPLFLF